MLYYAFNELMWLWSLITLSGIEMVLQNGDVWSEWCNPFGQNKGGMEETM